MKSTPAADLNNSAARFWLLPTLIVPMFSAPGFSFAAARTSCKVLNLPSPFAAKMKSK
ncbi:Uncharacterised protein [Mycobacterium tuberculosis]|nr:Uncharacterised protein [Mycobacterium tuberculosis]